MKVLKKYKNKVTKLLLTIFGFMFIFVLLMIIFHNYATDNRQMLVQTLNNSSKYAVLNGEVRSGWAHDYIADLLTLAPNGVLKSSLVTNEFYGEITELNLHGGIIPYSQDSYLIKIMLHDNKNGYVVTFYLNDPEFKSLNVFTEKDHILRPVSYTDMKLGDNVSVTETTDLFTGYDSSKITVVIEK